MKIFIINILLLLCVSNTYAQSKYYLDATNGDDANTGKSGSPWQTISRLNTFLASTANVPGDSIFLKRGETFLGCIIPGKSGTASKPIVFTCYGTGNKAVITGLRTISAWIGVTGLTSQWDGNVSGGLSGKLNILLYNGVPIPQGRYPDYNTTDGGFLAIDSHSGLTSLTASELTSNPSSGSFVGGEAVIRTTKSVMDRVTIGAHDKTLGKLTYTATPTTSEPTDTWGWFIQNHPSTLTTTNEWYYYGNLTTKKVRFYKPSSAPGTAVQVPIQTNLFFNAAKSYIVVRGLEFNGSNEDNIRITGGVGNKVLNCTIKNSGVSGIYISGSSYTVDGDSIINSMDLGIFSNGSTDRTITNNVIQNVGWWAGAGGSGDGAYEGIFIENLTSKLVCQYNRVSNVGFRGIVFKRGDTVDISYNYIDSFDLVKDDGGAINSFSNDDIIRKGRNIYNNIIKGHGIGTSKFGIGGVAGTQASVYGFYGDVKTSDVNLHDNYFDSCGRNGIELHGGNKRNIITNNTVFHCGIQMGTNDRGTQFYAYQDNGRLITGNTIKNNIFWTNGGKRRFMYLDDDANEAIPAIGIVDNNYYVSASDSLRFTYVRNSNDTTVNFTKWKSVTGFDANSVQVFPGGTIKVFANATKNSVVQDLTVGGTLYNWKDAKGVNYQSLTLAPYTVKVLIRGTVITTVDDAPVAADDVAETDVNVNLSGQTADNDNPSNDLPNTWSIVTQPTHGTVSMTAGTGNYTYVPDAGYTGSDQFTYKITDGDGDSDNAIVTITINAVASGFPAAANDAKTLNEDATGTITVGTNDTPSPDGGNVYALVGANGGALYGTVVLNNSSTGNLTYTPQANFNGYDSAYYSLCDGDGDCAYAWVVFHVLSVDDLPDAVNDLANTTEDNAVSGNVSTNDTESGDGSNVYSLVGTNGGSTHGTVTITSTGSFTYTPTTDYNGTNNFRYKLCDVDVDCDTATVSITVSSVDDLPGTGADNFSTNINTALAGNVSTNDTLSGDGGNTFTVVTNPSHGSVVMSSPTGSFTYTPTTSYTGSDVFTYKLCDGDGDCSSADVNLTVVSITDDQPTATADAFTLKQQSTLTGSVATNDDPSADTPNLWQVVSQPTNGTVTLTQSTGAFSYTPSGRYTGTDSWTYRIKDADGDYSNTVTVTMTITSKNKIRITTRLKTQ